MALGDAALRFASPLTLAGKTHLSGLVAGLTVALFAQTVLALAVRLAN